MICLWQCECTKWEIHFQDKHKIALFDCNIGKIKTYKYSSILKLPKTQNIWIKPSMQIYLISILYLITFTFFLFIILVQFWLSNEVDSMCPSLFSQNDLVVLNWFMYFYLYNCVINILKRVLPNLTKHYYSKTTLISILI